MKKHACFSIKKAIVAFAAPNLVMAAGWIWSITWGGVAFNGEGLYAESGFSAVDVVISAAFVLFLLILSVWAGFRGGADVRVGVAAFLLLPPLLFLLRFQLRAISPALPALAVIWYNPLAAAMFALGGLWGGFYYVMIFAYPVLCALAALLPGVLRAGRSLLRRS